jgi:hypothetical protein
VGQHAVQSIGDPGEESSAPGGRPAHAQCLRRPSDRAEPGEDAAGIKIDDRDDVQADGAPRLGQEHESERARPDDRDPYRIAGLGTPGKRLMETHRATLLGLASSSADHTAPSRNSTSPVSTGVSVPDRVHLTLPTTGHVYALAPAKLIGVRSYLRRRRPCDFFTRRRCQE